VVANPLPLTQASDLEPLIAGILGGAVSLAGLLLVFSGFLFARAASFSVNVDNAIPDRFKLAGKIALLPFAMALVLTISSMLYWLYPSQNVAYAIMAGFAVLLLVAGAYGLWALLIL
jgi:hypothetical protein